MKKKLFFIFSLLPLSLFADEAFTFFETERLVIKKLTSIEMLLVQAQDDEEANEIWDNFSQSFFDAQETSIFGDYYLFLKQRPDVQIGHFEFISPGENTDFPAHSEFTMGIHEDYQGYGYGTEALTALCQKFSQHLGGYPLRIDHDEDNDIWHTYKLDIPFKGILGRTSLCNRASISCMLKVGFASLGDQDAPKYTYPPLYTPSSPMA